MLSCPNLPTSSENSFANRVSFREVLTCVTSANKCCITNGGPKKGQIAPRIASSCKAQRKGGLSSTFFYPFEWLVW